MGVNNVLPGDAYGYPEAGHPTLPEWTKATKGIEYVQYDIYLRAVQSSGASNGELVAKKVYISDMVLDDATENKAVAEALRVHLNVDGGKKILISKTGIVEDTTTDPTNPYYGLPMFGNLDLDGDGYDDKVGGYEWTTGRDTLVTYGTNGTYQTTTGMADIVAPRNAQGNIVKGDTETDEHFAAKEICTTPDGTDSSVTSQKITVTVWLEGWHKFMNSATPSQESAIWESVKTAAASVRVGMTFDVGKDAFKA